MYIVVVYDINQKCGAKIMRLCRQYLEHVQNSVFEGEITNSNYKEFCGKIKEIMDVDFDSVIIYELWKAHFKRVIIGIEKRDINNII